MKHTSYLLSFIRPSLSGVRPEGSRLRLVLLAVPLALALKSTLALATGMVPETSLLLINEQDKGASMNVKNTDDHPSLLYTSFVDLPDDTGTHVIATQPVTRVEAGQTQRLRFILQTDAPLKVEHLKRLHLEGIPPKTKGKNQVVINIRQDLPVLIHPAGLPEKKDAWTLLTWHVSGNTVTVKNDSPYVVRMNSQAKMLPSGTGITLDKTYILPGQSLTTKATHSLSGDRQVTFYPASRYGVQVPDYTATLK